MEVPSRANPNYSSHLSSTDAESKYDYSKRIVRRAHFKPDEVDVLEEEDDVAKSQIFNPTKSISAIQSNVKEIGYWWSFCYELYTYDSDAHMKHSDQWNCSSPVKKPKSVLKRKFKGFLNSLDSWYLKTREESDRLKRLNFFDTSSAIYITNIIEVFEKLYDREAKKFYCPRNLKVLIRKINWIFQEIWDKSLNYSYIFTLVLKAKELIKEYQDKVAK